MNWMLLPPPPPRRRPPDNRSDAERRRDSLEVWIERETGRRARQKAAEDELPSLEAEWAALKADMPEPPPKPPKPEPLKPVDLRTSWTVDLLVAGMILLVVVASVVIGIIWEAL